MALESLQLFWVSWVSIVLFLYDCNCIFFFFWFQLCHLDFQFEGVSKEIQTTCVFFCFCEVGFRYFQVLAIYFGGRISDFLFRYFFHRKWTWFCMKAKNFIAIIAIFMPFSKLGHLNLQLLSLWSVWFWEFEVKAENLLFPSTPFSSFCLSCSMVLVEFNSRLWW